MSDRSVEIDFDGETMRMLEACARWRKIAVVDLAKAYIEDWLDIDFTFTSVARSPNTPWHPPGRPDHY